MAKSDNEHDRKAAVWLEQFSQKMETDPDMLESQPIEEIRAELESMGADAEGFHTKMANTLRRAKLKQAGSALIQWISPLWQPQWAGQFVGAGDIPEQTHTFTLERGKIDVSCFWKPQTGDTPAYLDLSWKVDILMEGELWCRFVQPDTNVVLAEVLLGTSREGGKYFTHQALGFDPSQEKWAIVILVKQKQ